MKLRPERLAQQLRPPFPPIYLISGDEPLLVQETCDLIRRAVLAGGDAERTVLEVDSGFDWNGLLQASSGMSLFSQRRLIELRMPDAKPGDRGSKALQEYLARPVADTTVLLVCGRLDAASQKSVWFRAVDAAGVVVQIWPPRLTELPAWVGQRMRAKGMKPTAGAAALLADRVEGNLLACVQEIEKLHLRYGAATVDEQAVMEAVADSARFDVFQLVDAVLAGDRERSARILNGVRGEGVEPPLVLWALTREIRAMARLAEAMTKGASAQQVLAGPGIWEQRKPLLAAALQRVAPETWLEALRHACDIDLRIKSGGSNVWDELLQLCFEMSGKRAVTV